VHFSAGERVLVALVPLPPHSIWHERLPEGGALAVAQRGMAVLRDPDPASVEQLAEFAALAPADRAGDAGAQALARMVADARPDLAEGALGQLAGRARLPDALGDAGQAALARALGDPGRPLALRRGVVLLAGERGLEGLRPALAAIAAPGSPLEAEALAAQARLAGGLAPEAMRRLLARPEPALRAVGVRHGGAALSDAELGKLASGDPAPEVRAAAAARLATRESPAALEAATRALLDADPAVRREVALALAGRGAPAVAPLRALAESLRAPDAGGPVAALGLMGSPGRAALEDLAADHPDPKVRELARFALGKPRPEH
jgi:hypothetical protein